MYKKAADGMADSVAHDQTAPFRNSHFRSSHVLSYTVHLGQTVPIFRILPQLYFVQCNLKRCLIRPVLQSTLDILNTDLELQMRGGIEDNSKIIFHVSQRRDISNDVSQNTFLWKKKAYHP